MGEDEHLSIYQILFDLQCTINDIYHISMFEIRRTNFHEFCVLVDRTGDRNRREKKKTHNGLKKVRAGDNWF